MHKKKEIQEHYSGEDIISLTMKGAIVRDLSAGGKIPLTFDGYQKVYKGNLLQCLFDIDVTPRCVGLIRNDGVTSPAYSQFEVHKEGFAPYYDYLLRYMDDNKVLLHLSKNLRSSLTEKDFGTIPTIIPSLSEQHLISSYLDAKCSEIDSALSLQEQMISELRAYKQSLITETVTHGLNPNAKMKNSGVEWIGEIPEGWEVRRLKSVIIGNLQYGANESGLLFQEGLPRYVRITDIVNNSLREDIQKQCLPEDVAKDYLLTHNDILFARSGGTVGKAFIYKERYGRCCFAGYLIKASINRYNNADFIYYFTQSYCYEEWKNNVFIQSTIQNIGADKYALLPIPLPPLSEQRSIATFLDEKCAEIDALIVLREKKMEALKEYKKSLIYECVTGKKQVI